MAGMYKIVNETVGPSSSYNNIIDQELDQIILTALNKDNETCYQASSEMKDDIDRYLKKENEKVVDLTF